MNNLARSDEAVEDRDDALNGFIGYNLKRVVSLVKADVAEVLAEFGLRTVTFSALSVVARHPGINQTQLAETLRIERSNLVQVVDALTSRNLVSRCKVAGDRRQYALVPTDEGRRLAARAQTAVARHEARVFAMLTGGEQEELQRLLRKIRDAWQ